MSPRPTGGRGSGQGRNQPSRNQPSRNQSGRSQPGKGQGRPAKKTGRVQKAQPGRVPARQAQPGRTPERAGRPEPGDRGPRNQRKDDGLGGEQVEGRQAVLELLRAGRRQVHQILVADGTDADGPTAQIVERAHQRGIPVHTVPRSRIDAAAATEAPQGVVATAEEVAPAELADLARGRAPGGLPPMLVVLDGVTDPHNLGAIMRTAVSAGASGLIVGKHRSARLTPAAVKAAAGAVEHLRIALVPGIPTALRELAAAGVWTVGLDADAPTPLWDLRVADEPVAVVLGAEGRGLTRLTRDTCEVTVAIPLTGPLGSLNVGAAAAVACFEVARGRTQTLR